MGIFAEYGAPAWSRWFRYLETRIGNPGNASDLKVTALPVALNAAWDDPIKSLAAYEAYKWGDWMPSNSWLYHANASKRISTGYMYFLTDATTKRLAQSGMSNEVRTATQNAEAQVNFYRQFLIAKQEEADKAWLDYAATHPKPGRLTKVQFYDQYKWQLAIDTLIRKLSAAAKQYQALVANIGDADLVLLEDASTRWSNPKQRIHLPQNKDVLNDPELWQEYYTSWIGDNIRDFLKESVPENQTINESSSASTYFEQQWSASVSVSFLGLFRAGGASAEQTKIEQHIRNNMTNLDVHFANVKTFPIERGEWFSGNALDRFAPIVDRTANFGPNGQLELIPQELLLGRGMSMFLYADSQSLDYFYEHFHASADAGFFVGPWRVGGGGDYSTTKSETKIEKYSDKIFIQDLSGRAKVMAVLSKYPAGALGAPHFLSLEAESVSKLPLVRSFETSLLLPTAPQPHSTFNIEAADYLERRWQADESLGARRLAETFQD
ncbi:hypothetical protein [Bradyrhizobium sp.]